MQLQKKIEKHYKYVFNEKLFLECPKTYNEKMQWSKFYDSTPIKTMLADKYAVRDWVKEKIGEEYLIPLLGVYDNFDEINFEKLPKRFVIKCNHGAGYNIIVTDKDKFDINDARKTIQAWLEEDYSLRAYEMQYKKIKKKIIIEEYIENNDCDLYDYKFWCFNGKVEYIQFLSERYTNGLKMAFFDKNWKKQEFVYNYPLNTKNIEKPANLEKMINLAEILATGWGHVRVDFYLLNNKDIKFGEMTFTTNAGYCIWNQQSINVLLGNLWNLPKVRYNLKKEKYYTQTMFAQYWEKTKYLIKKNLYSFKTRNRKHEK